MRPSIALIGSDATAGFELGNVQRGAPGYMLSGTGGGAGVLSGTMLWKLIDGAQELVVS
jgi:hypothetical protein